MTTPNRCTARGKDFEERMARGEADCVYHFALPELIDTIKDVGSADGLELVDMMVAGKDIADLPLDLAI